MGFHSTEWAYALTLPRAQKAVLVALAARANDSDGTCYPGQQTLAGMTGLSERTVRSAVKGLEERAVLRRLRRFDARGHRNSDLYILALKLTPESLPATVTTGKNDHRQKPARLPAKTDTPTGNSRRVIVSTSFSSSASTSGEKFNDGDYMIGDALGETFPEKPTGSHPHEANARSALETLQRDRRLPLHVKELLHHAYRLGDGDPWVGYGHIKQRTDATITAAKDPAAVLRARLKKEEVAA